MKAVFFLFICFLISSLAQAQYSGGGEANPNLVTHQQSLQDFKDMRFGMFIHWGPVSLKGEEISWSRGREIPIPEYDQLHSRFNPELFDAQEWAGLAKAAGMKYLILTSRHHDGFSLWDSKYTEYDMASTPYGRGIVKELAEACEQEGIKFGTYYSICDWYRDDYPVDYPSPDYSFREERKMDADTQKQMDQYIDFMKNQLRELVQEYSSFLIWFDGEWEWAWTHEMGMDMYAYLRGLNDKLLINNRVDKGREGMEDKSRDPRFAGDFATPEQSIGAFDRDYSWETCMTIGTQWAWKPDDKLKSAKECIHTLLRTIGGDGNLLFNVGPMPDGRIEARQVERLKEMGAWVKENSEAVYGTRGGPYLPTDKLTSTHKDSRIFLHLLEHPGKKLKLPQEEGFEIRNVHFLNETGSLPLARKKGQVVITLPDSLPDEVATVLVLELDRPAGGLPVYSLKP